MFVTKRIDKNYIAMTNRGVVVSLKSKADALTG